MMKRISRNKQLRKNFKQRQSRLQIYASRFLQQVVADKHKYINQI